MNADLLGCVEAAALACARFDERLRSSPVRDGVIRRLDFIEAKAVLANAHELVDLEDLVLDDVGMAIRAPTSEIIFARSVLQARRRIVALGRQAPTLATVDHLLGRRRVKPAAGPSYVDVSDSAVRGDGDDDDDDDDASERPNEDHAALLAQVDSLVLRSTESAHWAEHAVRLAPFPDRRDDDQREHLTDWLGALTRSEGHSLILVAAEGWAAWDGGDLLEEGWIGALIVAASLRLALVPKVLLPLHAGLRGTRGRRVLDRRGGRLRSYVGAIAAAAEVGLAEEDRLTRARAAHARICAGRRSSSRLPDLAQLFVDFPIVSAPFAARRLCVSQQAILAMIKELRPVLHERTDRKRYRAWSI